MQVPASKNVFPYIQHNPTEMYLLQACGQHFIWGGVFFEKSGPCVHLWAPKVLALLGGSRGMPPLGKFELNGSRRGQFLHSTLGILGKNIWSNWKILYKQFLEIGVFGQLYIYAEWIHESTNIFLQNIVQFQSSWVDSGKDVDCLFKIHSCIIVCVDEGQGGESFLRHAGMHEGVLEKS